VTDLELAAVRRHPSHDLSAPLVRPHLCLDIDVAGVTEESGVEVEGVADLGSRDVEVTTGIRVSSVGAHGDVLSRVDMILSSEKPIIQDWARQSKTYLHTCI